MLHVIMQRDEKSYLVLNVAFQPVLQFKDQNGDSSRLFYRNRENLSFYGELYDACRVYHSLYCKHPFGLQPLRPVRI